MADSEVENVLGVADKRHVQGETSRPGSMVGDGRYLTVSNLRTRLTNINGAYYTTARLNQMTKNDMLYAVRLSDDAAGI